MAISAMNVQAASANNTTRRAAGAKLPKTTRKGRRGGRRELLLLSTATATALVIGDSSTDLLNKYLKKSQENKAKNDKERLDSYYKRNYQDYFGVLEGDLKQKKDLSESEKGILEWIEKNK